MFHGLIKGELIRFVRTATNKEDYLNRAKLFKEKLLLRGYSANEFDTAFKSVDHGNRDTYLKEKDRKCRGKAPLVFTTTYNPHLRGFSKALSRNWEIISKNEKLNTIFPQKPLIVYRRGKNLKDFLVRARLKPIAGENSTK